MKIPKFLLVVGLVVSLSGCTMPTDSYVAVVKDTVAETVFEDTGQMASGCIGIYLICSQPMYEPVFFAPSTADVTEVCNDLIAVAKKLGVVAYGAQGYDAYKFSESNTDVLDLCVGGLGTALINTDGSDLFQGLVLYDDGAKDSYGKVFSLGRGPSEFGDGYLLIISFSRDSSRIGYITYGSQKPKLMTQSDLDAANGLNTVAGQTMQFATGLIGLTVQEAIQTAEAAGYSYAVWIRDGVDQPYDTKYDAKRILLNVYQGKIVDVFVG